MHAPEPSDPSPGPVRSPLHTGRSHPAPLLPAVLCALALLAPFPAEAMTLGPERLVEAYGLSIEVPGYSVPSFVRWDGDSLPDLIVGEGAGGVPDGKVRVYLNRGTAEVPLFGDFFFAQSDSADIILPAGGCLGVFPRVVHWDDDGRKDLLAGLSDGTILIFRNIGTDDDALFDAGTFVQVGEPGAKVDIDVGSRATPSLVDWDGDGREDLVTGAYDGRIRIFLDAGLDSVPDFRAETFAQEDSADLVVPSLRSSPVVIDIDGDGHKDLLTGNTEGELLLYLNTGTGEAPLFSGCTPLESWGVPIDLPGAARSRPFVCDWTGDGRLDVLVGAADGMIHRFQGIREPGVDAWFRNDPDAIAPR